MRTETEDWKLRTEDWFNVSFVILQPVHVATFFFMSSEILIMWVFSCQIPFWAENRCSSNVYNFFHRRRSVSRVYIFEKYSSRSLQKYILCGVTKHPEKNLQGPKVSFAKQKFRFSMSPSAPPPLVEIGVAVPPNFRFSQKESIFGRI